MTEKELNQLSKDALEELGRTQGVELDKRLTKKKLVAQIAKFFTITDTKAKSLHELKGEVVEEEAKVEAPTQVIPDRG